MSKFDEEIERICRKWSEERQEATGQTEDEALDFMTSHRGRYIISQALHKAIEVMESVEPEVRREVSNIADMKYLRHHLFSMYVPDQVLADATAQAHLLRKEVGE